MSTKKHILWLLIPMIILIATISQTAKITLADELIYDDETQKLIDEKNAAGEAYENLESEPIDPETVAWPFFKPIDSFSDVKEGNPHYLAIDFLARNGIVEGYTMNGEDTFKPKQKITRAEALKIFLLVSTTIKSFEDLGNKANALETKEPPFKDVPLDAWYTTYARIAKDANVISGYADGTFRPDKTINLAESLKLFLSCYPNIEYPPMDDIFADVPGDSWYAKFAMYAKQKTLVNVTLENKIDPNQDMTRGYMAEILYRKIMNDTENGIEFGKATYYGSGANGSNTASGEKLNNSEFVAAHKTLPFGTIVEVTNLATGKSIQVRIIDRGPYGHGRVIDLSSGAFSSLASLSTGVINIQLKVIE